ncbi:MAG: hypothetical protein ACRCZF_13770, partial [Gemmataceae bacterium]
MRRRWIATFSLLATVASTSVTAADVDLAPAFSAIRAVGKEGAGNDAATAAWKTIVKTGASALIPTLTDFRGASPQATNYLRSAIDAIAEAEAKAGRELPIGDLHRFLDDTKQSPAARRIAFELITKKEPMKKEHLLSGLVYDPSLELRRDAIAEKLVKVKKQPDADKKVVYETLFAAARDVDQVDEIVKLLEPLGAKPNLVAHYGLIDRWQVAGPFDSPEGAGFATAYPPEKGIDLTAKFTGKGGANFGWVPMTSTDKLAMIDLNKSLAKHKDAVVYAYAEIESPAARPVEIRVGSKNATRIQLNGQEIFAREEYHHGLSID